MRETTNLGLKITEGSDDWRDIFDDNADNMDALDEAVTKDASTTSAGRVNTGEQEFAGTKTFTGLKSKNTMNVHGTNSANYNVRLSGAPTDSGADGLIGIFSAMYSNLKSWLTMKVYGVNSQGKRINYYDEYKLPETAADKSANNTYDILTTKEVTLDANSQKAARRNISAVSNAEVAIMANGNTHAAIASGQAVIVRNHSSLSDGLYWASTAIATNATLSTSNLTADTSGGLNKLKGDIDSLNSNMVTYLADEPAVSNSGDGTKTYTIANAGLYLILVRGNASTASATPTIQITDSTGATVAQSGAAGGNVFAYKLTRLGANTEITVKVTNFTGGGTFSNYSRITILRLRG